jgi:hypothetical protein
MCYVIIYTTTLRVIDKLLVFLLLLLLYTFHSFFVILSFVSHHLFPSDINGLMLPWVRFGHSNHFTIPEGLLVTEAYTQRRPDCLPNRYGKAFSRLSRVKDVGHGHIAGYKNKLLASTEFGGLTGECLSCFVFFFPILM